MVERGSQVVVVQPPGTVFHANREAAFVLTHRAHFSDLDDASTALAEAFDVPLVTVREHLEDLERQLVVDPTQPTRTKYLDAARRNQAVVMLPEREVMAAMVDALGVCVQVVCHDPRTAGAVGPLLTAHGECVRPAERIDVWDDRGSVSIALNGRHMGTDSTLSLAVQRVVGLLTAIAVDADAGEGLLVHAAAVAVHGAGVVLAGASGVGKTSTTVELVRRGAGYLTDELVRIDPRTGSIVGLPRALGLEGPVRLHHPDLRPPWDDSDTDRRWSLSPSAVGTVRAAAPLAVLVFLDRDPDAPPAVDKIEWPESLTRMMPVLYHRESLSQPQIDALVGLLDSLPCFRVRHPTARAAADQVTALATAEVGDA